jgi:hypothetical protein
MMMPRCREAWLKIGFHGDRRVSEQTLIIPFRDGRMSSIFVVRGVS